jgi:hypothetical protein
VLDPCATALSTHLRIEQDGTITGITREGKHVVEAFNLNYSKSKAYRRRRIQSFARWKAKGDEWTIAEELAFPDDLPDLQRCRCTNTKPSGVSDSYFQKRKSGTLLETY